MYKKLAGIIIILSFPILIFNIIIVLGGDLIWEEKIYTVSGVRGDSNQYDWFVKGRVRGYYFVGDGIFVSSLHSTEASNKIWYDPFTRIGPSEVKVLARAYYKNQLVDFDFASTTSKPYIEIRLTEYVMADKIQTKSYAHMVYEGLYWYVWVVFDEWDVWINWSKLTLW